MFYSIICCKYPGGWLVSLLGFTCRRGGDYGGRLVFYLIICCMYTEGWSVGRRGEGLWWASGVLFNNLLYESRRLISLFTRVYMQAGRDYGGRLVFYLIICSMYPGGWSVCLLGFTCRRGGIMVAVCCSIITKGVVKCGIIRHFQSPPIEPLPLKRSNTRI